jgi:hypothetical protein
MNTQQMSLTCTSLCIRSFEVRPEGPFKSVSFSASAKSIRHALASLSFPFVAALKSALFRTFEMGTSLTPLLTQSFPISFLSIISLPFSVGFFVKREGIVDI